MRQINLKIMILIKAKFNLFIYLLYIISCFINIDILNLNIYIICNNNNI